MRAATAGFGALSRVELERFFYLDDEDRKLIAGRRRDYNRLGFALQIVTVRQLGMFLADPLDVPPELIDYLAEQLGIEDSSCVKQYTERDKTKLEHAWEIQREYDLTSFGEVESELAAWVADQAWTAAAVLDSTPVSNGGAKLQLVTDDYRAAEKGEPAAPHRTTAMARDERGHPIPRDEYAQHLQAQLDLAGGVGASGDLVTAGGVRLADQHAQVAAALLDELAGVYRGEPLGRLARQVAMTLYDRSGI